MFAQHRNDDAFVEPKLQRFNNNHRFLCKSFLKCNVFVKQERLFYFTPVNHSLFIVRGESVSHGLGHLKTGQIDFYSDTEAGSFDVICRRGNVSAPAVCNESFVWRAF